jgi:hypothetical protein
MNDIKEFVMQLLSTIEVSDEIDLASAEIEIIAERLAKNKKFHEYYDSIVEMVENAYIQRINEIME